MADIMMLEDGRLHGGSEPGRVFQQALALEQYAFHTANGGGEGVEMSE